MFCSIQQSNSSFNLSKHKPEFQQQQLQQQLDLEKMSQEDSATSAQDDHDQNRSLIVMCKHPAIENLSGCSSLYSARSAIKPGISVKESSSLPLEKCLYFESHKGIVVVLIYSIFVL
jgi:hypothetical protein